MPVEILGYAAGVAFIIGLAIFIDRHRAEDKEEKGKGKHHHA